MWDVNDNGAVKAAALEGGGHRADIRAVALSSDDAQLLSASNAAVKVCTSFLDGLIASAACAPLAAWPLSPLASLSSMLYLRLPPCYGAVE